MNQKKTKRVSLSQTFLLGLWTLGVLLVHSRFADAQTIYRWIDKSGTVHYGHQPPQDSIPSSFNDAPSKELGQQSTLAKVNNPQPVPFGKGLLWKIESGPSQTDRVVPSY